MLFFFALALALALPAASVEQGCGNSLGYDIRFSHDFGEIPSISSDRCSDTFKCAPPGSVGPFVRKIDPGCDAEAGPCALRLVFPLEFRGNRENIADVGLSGAPTPVIFWFDGEADADCRPWLSTSCGQVSICGQSPNKVPYDVIDTYLNLGEATCTNPVPTLHSGLLSILAASCPSRFSCPKRTFDSHDVTPAEVKKALGCIDPPKDDCDDCRSCPLSGVPADGRPPRIGGPALGAGGGAFLYYAGGGVGHPGYPGTAEHSVALGRYWTTDYHRRIAPFPDESRVFLLRRNGVFAEWSAPGPSGVYTQVSPSSEKRTLTWLGPGAGWELRNLDAAGIVDLFDASGRWLSTTDRNGNATVATYDASGSLELVEFADGRREELAYYPPADPSEGKLHTITEVGVDGATTRVWEYTWSGLDLVRVDRPDSTALELVYGEPGLPGHLTRIDLVGSDGASRRVVRAYEYSAEGRVTKTWRGDPSPTGPDAVDLWSLALDDPEEPTVALVTDPLGREITYQLGRDTVSSNVKVLSVSGDCPVCLGPNSQLAYDDPANPLLPTSITDARGTVTSLTYDAFGQVLSRTEADGEPGLQRTTFYTYDATYPALLTSVEQPSVAGGAATRETVWTRDASGNATGRTISGSEAGSAFSLTTTTSFNAAGQPLTIDPPGFGTADETSFTYDPARGNLVADTRTDPLVGTTTFGHDAFNRRTSVTDPNGVETTTSHDELDRVTEIRQVGASPPADDLVTGHEYTVFGDLFRSTLPEGNVVEYGYDPAGRLLSVERKPDAATPGERVLYTLDEAGNRTLEELQRWDAGASAWVTVSATAFEYSNRCQVDRIVQAPGTPEEAVTEQEYDCNGNLSAQWDPNHDAAV
ncbi:MAG TPA: hypothetical protein VLF66_01975, partial [Thermoanaerobaculia bacterium]|nr:hypothetical protein [Thermoanaerobaculia bacterium]